MVWEEKLTSRTPLWIALAGNCLVALATYGWLGWNTAAAHAAARNTARFSLLWFAVGFATPGLRRLFSCLPEEYRTIQAFVVAHCVHFATVTALTFSFERPHLLHHPIQALLVISIGFSITLTAGLTAAPRPLQAHSGLYTAALYLLFILFFLAFVKNPYKPLRLFAVLLGIALILRLTKYFAIEQPDKSRAAATSSR